jgi:hypothetical protein
MALLIPFIIIAAVIIIAGANRKTRDREVFNQLSSTNKKKVGAKRQIMQDEADELITVILPTINNNK